MIDLKDYLLIDYEFVEKFAATLKNSLYGVILLFFIIAIIFEIVNNGDILGVIKRLFLCVFVIGVFSTVHHYAVNTSFKIANNIANELSDTTTLLKGLNESMDEAIDKRNDFATGKGAWVWIKYNLLFGNVFSGLYSSFIILVAKILLLLSKAIYTVTHNINYGLIAIPSVFCILPPFKGSLSGALKTTAWCVVMPFVVLFLLMILSYEITHDIGRPIDHMAVTFCFLIMLVLSGGITWGLLAGTGVMSAATIGGAILGAKMSNMATKSFLNPILSGLGSNGMKKGFQFARNFKGSGNHKSSDVLSPFVSKNFANRSSEKFFKGFSDDDRSKSLNQKDFNNPQETTSKTNENTSRNHNTKTNVNNMSEQKSTENRQRTSNSNSDNVKNREQINSKNISMEKANKTNFQNERSTLSKSNKYVAENRINKDLQERSFQGRKNIKSNDLNGQFDKKLNKENLQQQIKIKRKGKRIDT